MSKNRSKACLALLPPADGPSTSVCLFPVPNLEYGCKGLALQEQRWWRWWLGARPGEVRQKCEQAGTTQSVMVHTTECFGGKGRLAPGQQRKKEENKRGGMSQERQRQKGESHKPLLRQQYYSGYVAVCDITVGLVASLADMEWSPWR